MHASSDGRLRIDADVILLSHPSADLSKAAKGNRKLHGAYRREIKKEVKTRLEKDTDYRPDRFPQTRDYFGKDTQRK